MAINLKLSQQGLILVAIPLVFELVFLSFLVGLLHQAELDVSREAHSKSVVSQANDLLQHFFDAAAALYGYRKTKETLFLERYERLSEGIPDEIRTLKRALLDYPNQEEAINRVEAVGKKSIEMLHRARELSNKEVSMDTALEAQQAAKELEGTIQSLVTQLHTFVDQEKLQAAGDPEIAAHSRLHVVQWIAFGFICNILIALTLALAFYRGTARRLTVLMDNTNSLAKNKPLKARLEGNDEIGRLDTVFHEMADALAAAAQHKADLMAMVSHDLRTPLTSIKGSLELLTSGAYGELNESANKLVTMAESNSKRLLHLINDLLDIERMEAGKLEMHLAPANLGDVFDQAVDAVAVFAGKSGIKVHVEPTDFEMMLDADRIVQVLVNLVSNSVKFSKADTQITLSSVIRDKEIEVRVTDQGRGIPKEFIDSVFDRFKQVDQADAKGRKGTGLGLAICKAIVEGHDGIIGVESEVGVGSTFYFRLPIKRPS